MSNIRKHADEMYTPLADSTKGRSCYCLRIMEHYRTSASEKQRQIKSPGTLARVLGHPPCPRGPPDLDLAQGIGRACPG